MRKIKGGRIKKRYESGTVHTVNLQFRNPSDRIMQNKAKKHCLTIVFFTFSDYNQTDRQQPAC